ncbi:filamentous hemagglutinin N-terminal domain-containing protein [Paraburkholderia phenoliruptrix]|uniref:two-partner secretion domain-containing protein n=1 Tax=Paraburkholderia phenoliruptrix TaxID=252970 RepID=UPI001C6E255E|nr:filamentous hemagglutinin N-terminal domain-containing protein [Paraburkholderia phenoliruptrix]MBW9102701.1 filamentous hemagglutinin N-terminal domain-containing protein [Paraburkholderia phenoliruptrix]MBW9128984.1 filamentous hemagglutinin N-terminal domain-containing protein [Paraburkholderia ginsengiterrae]
MSCRELPGLARRPVHGRQANGRLWLAIGISLTALPVAHETLAAGVLPQGGTYVAGTGAIASQGNGLVITQPGSTRGVIDWNSFSIGKTNSVMFDNGSGATLNRVTGGSSSAIRGRLSATGSLYLINPQGIVVGPSGVVSTGGRFVASTLDVCNDAFMRGSGALTLSGNSDASVINLGKISSSGGDVFLIARHAVINAGTLAAPDGTAELASGEQVLLQDSASSRQVFVQTGSQGTVVDNGRIMAAQVSLQAADGNVYALAGSGTRIRVTGTASRDGRVWLVADNGRVDQLGKIAASNADSSGGTVDTQAAELAFGKHAAVHAGQWNLSTSAFTIDDSAAHALQRSLNAGTSVNVATTGANGATGDLGVVSTLSWRGPASLTLAAYRHVSVTSGTTIANNGAGNLTLRADASGIDNGGSVNNGGTIDWSRSTGIVSALYDMSGSYNPGTIVANKAWTAAPYSGLLTQVTGYKLVNSVGDLQNIASDLGGAYALGKDIDASSTDTSFAFSPLGNATTPFSGQFDGRGHVIDRFTQLDQSSTGQPATGLFGAIGPTGVVRNVGMTNARVVTNFYFPSGIPLGILAGENQGLITSAYTTGGRGSGAFEGALLGGLVGRNDGLIARSWSSAVVGSAGVLGGLVGLNEGTILQSYATGDVSAGYHGVAGALAGLNAGTISQSYATGTSYGNLSTGGLVYSNSGTIEQSFAAGLVQGYCCSPPDTVTSFGGIAAYNQPGPGAGIATNVYWDKQATTRSVSAGTGPQLPASNGLTTAQMSDPASFVGWDFGPTGVWLMPAGASHPVLRWQAGH